jgi:hypothetical protein
MTSPGSGSRLRSTPLRAATPIALPIFTVLAVLGLFVMAWGPRSDDSDLHNREIGGVEYIGALNKLLPVVTDAQSAAVLGGQVSRSSFSDALDGVASVDEKYGSDLGTTDRWSNIRARIEALPALNGGDASGLYRSYSEVTDLMLALYGRAAETSGLVTDSNGVIFNLQDAAVQEVPGVIIWSARYQDQAVIAGKLVAPSSGDGADVNNALQDQLNTALTALAVARHTAGESGSDVATDMASAVDASKSGAFGTGLLRNLDTFQRNIEALAPPEKVSLTSRPAVSGVTKLRKDVQSSAVALNPLLLDELRGAVDDQKSTANSARILVAVLFLIAVLAAVGSLLIAVVSRRGRRPRRSESYGGRNGGGGDHRMGTEPVGAEAFMQSSDDGRDARRERVGVPR